MPEHVNKVPGTPLVGSSGQHTRTADTDGTVAYARTRVSERETSPLGMYLAQNKISDRMFARALGVTQRTVELWAKSRSIPSLVAAFEIERVTKGAVPIEIWFAFPKVKSELVRMRQRQKERR